MSRKMIAIAVTAGIALALLLAWQAPALSFYWAWNQRDESAQASLCDLWERDAREAWVRFNLFGDSPMTLTTTQFAERMREVCA